MKDKDLDIILPMMEYICDELCRHPHEVVDSEQLNEICDGCLMNDFTQDILAVK